MIETVKRVMVELGGYPSGDIERTRFILLGARRNLIFLVFGRGARAPSLVVKIARDPLYNRFLENEHVVLTKIAGGRAGDIAPRPCGLTHVRGVAVSLQTAVSGEKMMPRFHRFGFLNNRKKIEGHFRLAIRAASHIRGAAVDKKTAFDHSMKQDLVDGPVDFFLRSVKVDRGAGRLLERYVRGLESFLGEDIPMVLCHNDLNPHNLFVDGGQVRVIDWEFSRTSSFPLFDFYHFPFMYSFKYLPGDSRTKYEALFYRKGWGADIVRDYLGKISEVYGMDAGFLRALFPLYLIHVVERDLRNRFSTDWHPFLVGAVRYHFENEGRFLS